MKLRSVAPLLLALATLTSAQVPRSKHVIVVTMENHSYEEVIGNPDMPYFNSLVAKYALTTQYYATQHDSLPALFWLVAGQPLTNNDDTLESFDADNLVRQMAKDGGRTWKAYAGNLPYIGYTGYNVDPLYVKRHNPLAYFTDVANNPAQAANLVPMTPYFQQDIANGTLPEYSYVTPNLIDDAHDGTLAQGDAWLAANLPQLLASPQFQQDGILIIAWDEGEIDPSDERGGGGRVATIVAGPQVKSGGYRSNNFYNHQNLERTTCDALGLSHCPGAGANVLPMYDFFLGQPNTIPAQPVRSVLISAPTTVQATGAVNLQVDATAWDFQSSVDAMILYVDYNETYNNGGGALETMVALGQGSHELAVNAWNHQGTMFQAKQTITIGATSGGGTGGGSTTPTVNITAPSNGATVSSPFQLTGQATAPNSVDAMIVYVDYNEVYRTNGGTLNTTLTLPAGTHQIAVNAWDSKGTMFQAKENITVASATAAPSVKITSPSSGTTVTSPFQLTAQATSSNPIDAMIVYVDYNEVYRTYSGTVNTTLSLAAGTHQIAVNAWDSKGTMFQAKENITVASTSTCGASSPTLTVAICSPAAGSTSASPAHVVAQGNDSSSPVSALIVYVDDQEVYRTLTNRVDTFITLPAGLHSLVVNGWDNAGKFAQARESITIK